MKPGSCSLHSMLLAACIAVASSGCQRGPGSEQVRQHVKARLTNSFGSGLFRITHFKRRGHYPYKQNDGTPGALVYYDAELQLERDYRFTNWNQLNVGSLISVLGATPQGVDGVQPKGNHKGDRLHVRGTSAYAKQGERWKPVAYSPATKAARVPPGADKETLPYRNRLRRLGQIGAQLHKRKDQEDIRALTAQLDEVLAAADRRLGRALGKLTLGTGNPSGEYHRQGQALVQVLKRAGIKAQAYPTSGSTENCRLVDSGELAFAYSQNDVAHMAAAGTDLFKGQLPLKNLRALCSLYPEAVQIVTRRGAGVQSVAQLQGKRVDVGRPGSGVRVNALQVLRAAGLELSALGQARGQTISHALADLRRGTVDAVFLTSAYPNPALFRLADEVPVDIVPLSRETVERLRERHPYFIPVELPANTYPSLTQKRLTVQVTATLLTHRSTKDKRVTSLLHQLFTNVSALSRGSQQAYLISPRTALSGLSIPLHPAAKRYFEQHK